MVLFVFVQRVGRPGTFRFVLIRGEPRQPPLQFGIFGRNPDLLKNKGNQPCRVSVARSFLTLKLLIFRCRVLHHPLLWHLVKGAYDRVRNMGRPIFWSYLGR